MKINNRSIEELQKEIDFLYLYPPAPMWRIEKAQKELDELLMAKGIFCSRCYIEGSELLECGHSKQHLEELELQEVE